MIFSIASTATDFPKSSNSFCIDFRSNFSSLASTENVVQKPHSSNSCSDKSSNFPVLTSFCSTYNPPTCPLAFSAMVAAEKDFALMASSLILPSSVR